MPDEHDHMLFITRALQSGGVVVKITERRRETTEIVVQRTVVIARPPSKKSMMWRTIGEACAWLARTALAFVGAVPSASRSESRTE
jgi:hypothetical protein